MWDDLLIDGVSLSSLGVIEDFSGIARNAGPPRGQNVTIPGRAGDVHVPKVRGAYEFAVPLAVLATSHGGRMQTLATLEALLDSTAGPLLLTRRMTVGVTQTEQTCAGDYLSGLEPSLIGIDTARIALVLVNLDGLWS